MMSGGVSRNMGMGAEGGTRSGTGAGGSAAEGGNAIGANGG